MTSHAKKPAENMVLGQLMTNRILDPRILNAMQDVPREPFLPEKLRGAAYVDEDLEVAPGRGLIAPLTLAQLLHLAEVTSDAIPYLLLSGACLVTFAVLWRSRSSS